MDDSARDTAGMRTVFWTWMAIIVGGLAFIITTALGGR